MALASDRAVADNTRFITSTWLATIALITYDYLLTFSDEVHYIWARGSKPTKIIFAVCRYSTIVTLIMTMSVCDLGLARIESARCQSCYYWFPYMSLLTYAMDASVLILRVNALYNCARRLRHALFTMLGALLVFGVVFFTVLAVHGPSASTLSSSLTAALTCRRPLRAAAPAGRTSRCWTITFPRWAWTFWLAKVVLEGTLLALALARTLGAWARPALHATVHCPSTQHTSAQQPSALVRLLMRDSLFACTGTLSLALVNIVLWCGTNKALFYAFPGMSLAVEGVIASRLLLNLHAYTSNPDSSLGMHEGELLCIHSPEDLERVELAAPGTLDSDSAGSR